MKRKKLWGALILFIMMLMLSGMSTVHASSFDSPSVIEGLLGASKTGWVQKGSQWYYYRSGKPIKNQWLTVGGKKYYLKSDGVMAIGWYTVGNKKYYFNSSGAMQTGWVRWKNSWYYTSKKNGAMLQGQFAKNSKGQYYYFLSNGKMATGFVKVGKYYRYFNSNGIMAVGWKQIDGKWYYFNKSGVRRTGLVIDNGKRYYMNSQGVMQTGWMTVNGNRYYAYKSGELATGWVRSGKGNKYYFSQAGKQALGLTKVGSKYYYFEKENNGIMAVDKTIGGRYFGKDGVYIPNHVAGVNLRWPLDSDCNYITSYFGNRESPGGIGSTNHMGIDIAASTGRKIYAAEAGTIVVRTYSSSAGNYIEINHTNGLITQYMHQSKFASGLTVGSKVKKGQVIGYVGSTGNSTGPHLHFGVKRNGVYANPLDYVKRP
ncbi:MAG: peptidoglycan DD-metalloendopeptidase family protein [Blautia sp.]|jgi:glucan-binding YG repeat protein